MNIIIISGTVGQVSDTVSKNGLAIREFSVLEQRDDGGSSKAHVFKMFGDNIEKNPVTQGDLVEVQGSVKSSRYTARGGEEYARCELLAWRVAKLVPALPKAMHPSLRDGLDLGPAEEDIPF